MVSGTTILYVHCNKLAKKGGLAWKTKGNLREKTKMKLFVRNKWQREMPRNEFFFSHEMKMTVMIVIFCTSSNTCGSYYQWGRRLEGHPARLE